MLASGIDPSAAKTERKYLTSQNAANTFEAVAREWHKHDLHLTPEQFKAWSQNMGHDKPLTTLNSYGHVSLERQGEIITGLGRERKAEDSGEDMAA